MRRVSGTVLVVGLLGTIVVGTGRGDSCGAAVEWRGQLYEGLSERVALPLGDRVGTGTDPCPAGPRCSGAKQRRVTLLEVQGADPAVAIGTAEDSVVYAAVGYVVQQPEHPLHDVLYPARERKRERERRRRCGRPYSVRAQVEEHSIVALSLAVDGRGERLVPFVDSRTEFVGLERNGLAYLPEGTRVRVRVLPCETAGGRSRPVADVIRAEAA